MQVKTRAKAVGYVVNHNETLVQSKQPAASLKVKTGLKAGRQATLPIPQEHINHFGALGRDGAIMQVKTWIKAESPKEQHNETLVQVQKPTPGLKVKTGVKAGRIIVTLPPTLAG